MSNSMTEKQIPGPPTLQLVDDLLHHPLVPKMTSLEPKSVGHLFK